MASILKYSKVMVELISMSKKLEIILVINNVHFFLCFLFIILCTACKLLNFLIHLLMLQNPSTKIHNFQILFGCYFDYWRASKKEFEIYFGFYHQATESCFHLLIFVVIYFYYMFFLLIWRLTKCKIQNKQHRKKYGL